MLVEYPVQSSCLYASGIRESPSLVLQERLDGLPGHAQGGAKVHNPLNLDVEHPVLQDRVDPVVGYTCDIKVRPAKEGNVNNTAALRSSVAQLRERYCTPPLGSTQARIAMLCIVPTLTGRPQSYARQQHRWVAIEPSGQLNVVVVGLAHAAFYHPAVCTLQKVYGPEDLRGGPLPEHRTIAACDVNVARPHVCQVAVLLSEAGEQGPQASRHCLSEKTAVATATSR